MKVLQSGGSLMIGVHHAGAEARYLTVSCNPQSRVPRCTRHSGNYVANNMRFQDHAWSRRHQRSLQLKIHAQAVPGTTELEQPQNGKSALVEAPRSPFNTGSTNLSTAGPGAPLVNHPLEAEKTVVFVRHGLTTWNEQKRIQASSSTWQLLNAT